MIRRDQVVILNLSGTLYTRVSDLLGMEYGSSGERIEPGGKTGRMCNGLKSGCGTDNNDRHCTSEVNTSFKSDESKKA
jgi:hypothetical protein